MKLQHIVDIADDWMNPIVVKELRQAMRSKFITRMFSLFLFVQVGILGIYLMTQNWQTPDNFYIGRDLYQIFLGVLSFIGILCLPGYIAMRLGSERSDLNVDLLFNTTLSPRHIILGKFFSSLILAVLVYSACMPFMAFTYLMRGIDLPTIFATMAFVFLVTACGVQATIFLSCISTARSSKSLLGIGAAFGFFMAYGVTFGISNSIIMSGIDIPKFWETAISVLIIVLLGMSFLYVMSVALITPPSANRILPVRIATLLCWLIGTGVCLYWLLELRDREIGQLWCITSIFLGSAGILLAISERDTLGVRVRRQIPHWQPLRALAFLFYSGAAAGVIFHVGLILVSLAMAYCAEYFIDTNLFHRELIGYIGISLAIYNYALSAVWLRRKFIPHRVPHTQNWALALGLMLLGIFLPMFLSLMIFENRYENNALTWIGNPFAISAMSGYSAIVGIREVFFAFNLIWALAITLLNWRWFAQQIANFQPLAPVTPKEAQS